MSDSFAQLIPDARAFLSDLAANNDRDWFKEHKPRYDAELKAPALLLLDQVTTDIARDGDLQVSTKLFRPHRDVRFSKDKTPYTTHLHMGWTLHADGCGDTGFFFGIAPDYVRIGGGVMGFDKDQLNRWRAAVDKGDGKRAEQLVQDLQANGMKCGDPELKRVPTPYSKDHPRCDLLRRKSLMLWKDLDKKDWNAPQAALKQSYALLTPLLGFLRDTI
jgi:uncharacterized protein (TIGR02453 family)